MKIIEAVREALALESKTIELTEELEKAMQALGNARQELADLVGDTRQMSVLVELHGHVFEATSSGMVRQRDVIREPDTNAATAITVTVKDQGVL